MPFPSAAARLTNMLVGTDDCGTRVLVRGGASRGLPSVPGSRECRRNSPSMGRPRMQSVRACRHECSGPAITSETSNPGSAQHTANLAYNAGASHPRLINDHNFSFGRKRMSSRQPLRKLNVLDAGLRCAHTSLAVRNHALCAPPRDCEHRDRSPKTRGGAAAARGG
jgi:hypothetical protein